MATMPLADRSTCLNLSGELMSTLGPSLRTPIPIDGLTAEHRYGCEPGHDLTAERLFERRWALTLLDHVFDELEAELAKAERKSIEEKLANAQAKVREILIELETATAETQRLQALLG